MNQIDTETLKKLEIDELLSMLPVLLVNNGKVYAEAVAEMPEGKEKLKIDFTKAKKADKKELARKLGTGFIRVKANYGKDKEKEYFLKKRK